MNALPQIQIIDLALYCDSTIIIADIHIGYEEALNKQGVLVPRLQFEEIVKRMEIILGKTGKVERIVINGDLKHEFGTISEQEWRNTLKFLDLLAKHCNEIILVKGNHDTVLGPIARKRNIKVVDYYVFKADIDKRNSDTTITITGINNKINKFIKHRRNKILVAHGDKIPPNDAFLDVSTIIIGHEHPAVSLKDGARVESFKCFLKGKYRGKNLIVQPSFNTMTEGTNVLRDNILSPFLKQNLDNFDVYVVEDKVYEFGKLEKLR